MDGIVELEAALSGLIGQLDPGGRRALARLMASRLRRSNQDRIAAQVTPAGSPFTPRLRRENGSIRRKMFSRLRTSRWLKSRSTDNEAVVEFVGQAARIARVHHEGLRDRVRPGGPEHQYAARALLGFSGADLELLESLIIEHLAR